VSSNARGSIASNEQSIEEFVSDLADCREQAVIAYLRKYRPSDLMFFRVPRGK
jgi:hypothetical protein